MKRLPLIFLALIYATSIFTQDQPRKPGLSKKILNNSENINTLVASSDDLSNYVNKLFNSSDVQISNITVSGGASQSGIFSGGLSSIGIEQGIIITSGHASIAGGPNYGEGSGASAGGGYNDIELQSIGPGGSIYDVYTLEFDLIPNKHVISIKYVFGSEEYEEYSCSQFNDVFGLFVSGPGYSGYENVALIPGTYIPVKINTVNQGIPGAFGNIQYCTEQKNGSVAYSSYYVSNPVGSPDVQYDGFTKPLNAVFLVEPGEKYHIKIAIADAGDAVFDSGLFIGYNNYVGDTLLQPRAEIEATRVGSGLYNFKGITQYATEYFWDFGDGVTSNLKNPSKHKYAQEGKYLVKLIASNFCCSDTAELLLDVKFTVLTASYITSSPSCYDKCDGAILVNVSGGTEPYQYTWDFGINFPEVIGICKGVYTVTITDVEGFSTILDVTVEAPDPLIINIFQTAGVDQPITTTAVVKGGTPPYIYKWSDGKTSATRFDLKKGQAYLLKVTDINGCTTEISKKGSQGSIPKFKPEIELKITGRELNINTVMEAGTYSLTIFNSMGQNLWSENNLIDSQKVVDTKEWVSGIYFVQLIAQDQLIQKSIFIK